MYVMGASSGEDPSSGLTFGTGTCPGSYVESSRYGLYVGFRQPKDEISSRQAPFDLQFPNIRHAVTSHQINWKNKDTATKPSVGIGCLIDRSHDSCRVASHPFLLAALGAGEPRKPWAMMSGGTAAMGSENASQSSLLIANDSETMQPSARMSIHWNRLPTPPVWLITYCPFYY